MTNSRWRKLVVGTFIAASIGLSCTITAEADTGRSMRSGPAAQMITCFVTTDRVPYYGVWIHSNHLNCP